MTLNEWEKSFPDPGIMPPRPAETQPPPEAGLPALREWHAQFDAHNKWILANRRFLVARSCDLLEAKQAASLAATEGAHVKLDATEMICLVLGVHYLQGDAGTGGPDDLFSILLGGFR